MSSSHTELLRVCPVCSGRFIRPVAGFREQHLVRCAICQLVFDERTPTEGELLDYYRQYSYSNQKPCASATRSSFERLLQALQPYRQLGNILDVGCGQGDFLDTARKVGWNVEGTEYSEAAVNICHSRGLSVRQGELDADSLGSKLFDVVTAFEVIEHVNHPNALLAQIGSLLRPGGLFYCTTPNFNAALRYAEKGAFEMICYPEHLCFYTKKSLRYLAERHKFDAQLIQTTGIDLRRVKSFFGGGIRATGPSVTYLSNRQELDTFRSKVDSNASLRFAKQAVNGVLSLTGLGDTLKGFLIKRG